MPRLPPFASQPDFERLQGTLGQVQNTIERNGILIRELQGALKKAQDDAAAATAMRILATQKLLGAANAYIGHSSGSFYFDVAKTQPVRLQYTPPVPAWWEVVAVVGTMQKLDANYHYMQASLTLSPVDVDGDTGPIISLTQHASVQQYSFYILRAIYKLNANVAYSATAGAGVSGGTWQYFSSTNALRIDGKAWAR